MTSDLLSVSVSGLRVSQTALSTTGHNISNAGVEGYSRQQVNATTRPAILLGSGYVGTGSSVESIERIVNQFVISQLRIDTSLSTDLDAYHNNVSQLDNLLSNSASGLSGAMESFFSSMQNGADDPTSIPARQLIVSEAENLSDRFNILHSKFDEIQNGIEDSLASAVVQVNSLTQNLADINRKVSEVIATGRGGLPNDLLDQQDKTLQDLSELISIQTYDEGNGRVNVVVGSGQSLVVGNDARTLYLEPSASDYSKTDLVFADETSRQVITGLVSGGEIGGQLRFRDEIMNQVYNEFGRIAVVVADSFNQAHRMGVTLDNEFGENIFFDVNDAEVAQQRVVASSNNADTGNKVIKLNFSDSNQLETSNYLVQFESAGLFKVERLSDGEEVATGLLTSDFPFAVEFDGLELVFEQGAFAKGDQFQLAPFRSGARDFASAIKDPNQLAFAGPLATEASIGNQGSGTVSSGEVLSLTDQQGLPLPLLENVGELSPPMIIRFTSDTTYDVLDNSDPGNPVHLDPPLRNQHFVPGTDNAVFPVDPAALTVSTQGDMIGIAQGRQAVTQAAILMATPPAAAPNYVVSDFSNTADQFSFDLVINNSLSGSNDGTFNIVINGPQISDNSSLLTTINTQLASSDALAYIADNGSLAFRLKTPGFGDLSLQNYNGDPDGDANVALAGQASNLLGFDIETSSFTSAANADGVSGVGFRTNGYPAEVITITRESEYTGTAETTQNIYTELNASAKQIANSLNNVNGVSANAYNFVELSNYQVNRAAPLQVFLNGESLLEYDFDTTIDAEVLSPAVPDPQTETADFNEYLAQRINEMPIFQQQGIYAKQQTDYATGISSLQIHSIHGDDLEIAFSAASGETIDVGDGEGANLQLQAAGNSLTSSIVVGGRLDVELAEGLSLGTFPPQSLLFGDTTATDFAKTNYRGIQVSLSGQPQEGDDFYINFNLDGALDNRNALRLVGLQQNQIMDKGATSISDAYAALVERVGIDTNAARINSEASQRVLEQTLDLRNSVSGVNLDEEAANLIRFQQMYSANTQVISMARDLFDTLLSSF